VPPFKLVFIINIIIKLNRCQDLFWQGLQDLSNI
jgi:hypothetical protein